MLDHVLSFKGEAKKVQNRIVEYNLYKIAHKGSGFDSYIVLHNLPHWGKIVNLFKKEAGIISIKIFNGCVDEMKKKILTIFNLDLGESILVVV